MTSWVVWAVAAAVAGLIGFTGRRFSVRTLRYVTAFAVIALLITVTAYGQTPSVTRGASDLETSFAFGADRLSAAFFHPLWTMASARHTPAPGRLGWSVIAVALLLGYRQLEAWAVRRQAPQLDTAKLGDVQPSITGDGSEDGADGDGRLTAGQRHEWLAAEVRFRLAAVDVYAPPILPGGSRSEGLASIAEASGVSGGGLAGAIIRFAGSLWPSARRFELRVWVEAAPRRAAVRPGEARAALTQADSIPPGTKAVTIQAGTPRAVTVWAGNAREANEERVAETTRVTVELDEPKAGRTVASKTIAAETIDEAASMVAGYVARQIFARDPDSPTWAYGASDGRDLGALLLARQERVYVESVDDVRASRRQQIEQLWSVTGVDRCAGVVRYELAQLEDLDREHLIALRLHAMNREQYPRFFRGTYRLCMSLEMIADPAFTVFNPAAARVILDETLNILYRAGLAAVDRSAAQDLHFKQGAGGPSVLSHALRETLLGASQRELRAIRRQLSLAMVIWNTFWRRSERTVWLPQWRRAMRQSFRDGICVAELLVAVKRRLNERYQTQHQGRPPGRGPGRAERFRQRKGLQVVTAIMGDAAPVRAVLWTPFGAWPAAAPAPQGRATGPVPAGWIPPTRDRVRWLPWQSRTASWQAAYNTACLFAVLARHRLADEEQVVASLRRVVTNVESGVERPYDWISHDPDFAPLLLPEAPYPKLHEFMAAQERRDYPARQVFHTREAPSGSFRAPALD